MPRNNNIQFRRGTNTQWSSANPILASGEPGFVTDFNILKIGDGTKQWDDLSAINEALTTIVYNNTASTIPKMSVVYINGAQGDTPTIQLAIASGELTSSKTYGITTGDITAGGIGSVVAEGALKHLSTSPTFDGVTPGTVLYLSPSTSGGITTTKPSSPNHIVALGNLIRVHNQQGIINVKIQNGFELGELHNVAINGTSDGQFLQYNSASGLWVASSSGNFTTLNVNNNIVWHSGNFNTSNIVRTTGVQTITGNKTFSNTTTTLFEDGSYVSYGMSTPEYAVDILTDSFPWVFRARDLNNGTEFSVGNPTNMDNDITISTIDDIHINYGTIAFNGQTLFQAAIGAGSNGQLLIGNGSSFSYSTLTAGTGIGITNGSGAITIAVTGIPSSTITNFNSAVSGLLPTISNSGDNRVLTSTGSSVGINAESNLTFDGTTLNAPLIIATQAVGDEGGEIQLAKAPNGSLSGSIVIDSYQNKLRFFENGGTARGFYLDISAGGAGASTNIGGGGSATTVSNYADNRIITSDGTATGLNAETNFTFDGSLLNITGSGNFSSDLSVNGSLITSSITGSDPLTISTQTASLIINDYTIYPQNDIDTSSNIKLSAQSADSLLITDSNQNIVSSSSPTLTELSYVSGVTSNIQTQLDSKQNTLTNPVTGTGLVNHIPYWSSTSGLLADTSQLIWDATNNRLGIGTSSPSFALDVSGAIRSTSYITSNTEFRLNNAAFSRVATMDAAGSFAGGYNVYLSGTTPKHNSTGAVSSYYYHSDGSIRFYTNSSQAADTNASERLRISSDGNVGIGTSSPGATLDVRGAAVFNEDSGDHDFRVESDGATHMFFIDAGLNRIGINTASPGSTLDVRGSVIFNEDGGDLDFRAEGDTDANLLFVDASTDRVGIGTATPGYKLQVSGSFGATTKSFRIDHPSKKGWNLEYGSLESPYHGVRLTGRGKVIKGVGTVDLPDYLKDLIHDDESIVIQLTNYKHGKTLYVDKIDLQNNSFIVKADRAKTLGELEFFWTLTGVRKDVDHLVVEKRN